MTGVVFDKGEHGRSGGVSFLSLVLKTSTQVARDTFFSSFNSYSVKKQVFPVCVALVLKYQLSSNCLADQLS